MCGERGQEERERGRGGERERGREHKLALHPGSLGIWFNRLLTYKRKSQLAGLKKLCQQIQTCLGTLRW